MSEGRVVSINVSNGGVPKRPVERARITRSGVEGDRQEDKAHHGGPDRAVSVFALEVIERLRSEGHPIAPGTAGENLTMAGLDWAKVAPGAQLVFEGGVTLEVASYCSPCRTIAASFKDGESKRISQKLHPGESRVYCSVVVEGEVRAAEGVQVTQSPSGTDRRLSDTGGAAVEGS